MTVHVRRDQSLELVCRGVDGFDGRRLLPLCGLNHLRDPVVGRLPDQVNTEKTHEGVNSALKKNNKYLFVFKIVFIQQTF
jgi:hypothetical protein